MHLAKKKKNKPNSEGSDLEISQQNICDKQ
jgi:hypothetical protein